MVRTVTGAVVVALLAAIGPAACSTASGEPKLGPIGSVRTADDIKLPMDRYWFTPAQAKIVDEARLKVVRVCARRFGFEVNTSESDAAPDNNHARLYGILSLGEATASGYRVPPAADAGGRPAAGWNPSDDEFTVVRGVDRAAGKPATGQLIRGIPVPDGGCAGEADRAIGQGAGTVPREAAARPEEIALQAHRAAEKDSRVVTAFGEWSECMTRAGYHYQNPWQPNDRQWGESPTAEEKATAEADVRCRWETNLVGRWMAVETAYQSRMAADHKDELARLRKSLDIRAENATTIVDG